MCEIYIFDARWDMKSQSRNQDPNKTATIILDGAIQEKTDNG